jgi:RHS repeat-associated protein
VAGTSTYDQTYTYDGLHRLKTVDESTAANDRYWELDQLGNWPKLRQGLTSSSTVLEERTHNKDNELTAFVAPTNYVDPAYDDAGNMTTMPQPATPTASFTLKYDAWNRLVEVSASAGLIAKYAYDGLGQRIVKDVSGTADDRDYYYNDRWQLLTEWKGGPSGAVEAIYQWHPYYIDALNLRMRASNMHSFMHDANFNVTAAVDDATNSVVERYAYTPYGEVTFLNSSFGSISNSSIGNNHLYTGRERDPETGLQLNRHRYYAAHLGRWLMRDPVGYRGGANLYGYVSERPTELIDPSGLDWFGWDWPTVPKCVWASTNRSDCQQCCAQKGANWARKECNEACDEKWPPPPDGTPPGGSSLGRIMPPPVVRPVRPPGLGIGVRPGVGLGLGAAAGAAAADGPIPAGDIVAIAIIIKLLERCEEEDCHCCVTYYRTNEWHSLGTMTRSECKNQGFVIGGITRCSEKGDCTDVSVEDDPL